MFRQPGRIVEGAIASGRGEPLWAMKIALQVLIFGVPVPKLIFAVLAFWALSILPAAAQTAADVNASIDNVLGDHTPYGETFAAIQAAVAADDAEALAEWVAYPFNVTVDGEDYSFDGPDGFVEHYEGIVTPEVRQAVIDQKYGDLFVNTEGVMFGNGQMWLDGICKDDACAEFDVRIITIQSTAAD
jgi:hypothetical protein